MADALDLKVEWDNDAVQGELGQMEPDLLYILEDASVPLQIQAKLGYSGFRSVASLRGLGESRADIKDCMKDDLGLDPIQGMKVRATIAAVQAAWEAAKAFVEKKTSMDAEERLRGEPRAMKVSEFNRLKSSLETILQKGKLPEEQIPAPSLIESIVTCIEEGEWPAFQLDEIATKKEADGEQPLMTPQVLRDGTFRMSKRIKLKVGLPTTSEAFRMRIRLLGRAMCMVKLKLSNVAWLRTCSREVWEDHVDYILGHKIWGLEAKDMNGVVTKKPTWNMVLEYEYKVREKASEFINDDRLDISAAMKKARLDTRTLQEHFLTPLAIGTAPSAGYSKVTGETPPPPSSDGISKRMRKALKKFQAASAAASSSTHFSQKGGGKQKGKGGGKDGNKSKRAKTGQEKARNGLYRNTPDGKPICFKYNNDEGCDGSCGRVHCCQGCLSLDHPLTKCPKR